MLFAEKLKTLRVASGLSQEEIAETLGVTLRTYWNYEAGRMYPKRTDSYGKLAKMFNVTTDYLLSEEDYCYIDAQDKGGKRALKDVKKLVTEFGGLFAGGELSEDDKEEVMMSLLELYWKARKINKEKDAPKKLGKATAQTKD